MAGQDSDGRRSPSASSSSSSFGANDEPDHDWVARQMKLRRPDYTETLAVSLKIVSWNVNGKRVGEDLTSLLLEDTEPGIYAIGLQEMDLGKSAYVVHDPSYEIEWTAAIASALGDHYEKIASHQLVGIFLVVYVNKALMPVVGAVQKSHLATGHFSLLGNKGGTAVRLRVYDTTICFVNLHLYHVVEATARRTEDVRRIMRELVFDEAAKIKAHDHVFLFGDLNYRVEATTEEAKEILDNGPLDKLLERDQLRQAMAVNKTFRGFHEAEITFPPTYKYDLGTTTFDTSEKNRTPSWTDRILWKSDLPISALRYTSHPLNVMSDHKPISAFFDVCVEVIIPARFQTTHASVLRELDRLENDARPNISISTEQLHFGQVSFLDPITRSFTIRNNGNGLAYFEFQELRAHDNVNQRDFIFIRPLKGSLGPAESMTIDITILVGNKTIPFVAMGRQLDEILVLEIRNGRHIFISLQGDFQRTCFGLPLEYLASLGGKGARNVEATASRDSGGGMPNELWRMMEHILKYGQTCGSVFLERGDEGMCKRVREALDTAMPFDGLEGDMGVLSVGETLLRYLDALPQTIIPENLYERAIRIAESKGSIMELADILPGTHMNVLIFLVSSIRKVLEWPVFLQNPEGKRRIVRAFAKVLIRHPPPGRPDELRRKESLVSGLLDE